jgi:hypothetical protein
MFSSVWGLITFGVLTIGLFAYGIYKHEQRLEETERKIDETQVRYLKSKGKA